MFDSNKRSTQTTGSTAGSTEAVKDPVCGMSIRADSAFGRQEYAGRTFYFCSASCQEKFRREPGKYTGS
ncbi:MAG: YHS domain-containing protein [Candidatus Acidiferrales bacterium]